MTDPFVPIQPSFNSAQALDLNKSGLRVAGLNVYQGKAQVVFDLNFEVLPGQALVLQGANGAGKSSVMKAIIGLLPHEATQLSLNGANLLGRSTDVIARLGVGYVPENRRIFTRLTVLENLQLAQTDRLKNFNADRQLWTLDSVLTVLPALAPLLKRMGDSISGGEQRMLALGRALMLNPTLLLLDEPCEGVAPKVADAIADTLQRCMAQGVAILISESHDGFAQRLGARVLSLHAGHAQA